MWLFVFRIHLHGGRSENRSRLSEVRFIQWTHSGTIFYFRLCLPALVPGKILKIQISGTIPAWISVIMQSYTSFCRNSSRRNWFSWLLVLGLYKDAYLQITNALLITQLMRLVCWDPVIRFNHTSWVTMVTPNDRLKSVCNRYVIEVFGTLVLSRNSRCVLGFVWV